MGFSKLKSFFFLTLLKRILKNGKSFIKVADNKVDEDVLLFFFVSETWKKKYKLFFLKKTTRTLILVKKAVLNLEQHSRFIAIVAATCSKRELEHYQYVWLQHTT